MPTFVDPNVVHMAAVCGLLLSAIRFVLFSSMRLALERVAPICWGVKGLFNGSWGHPFHQIQGTASLVVGTTRSCPTEWLLADNRAGWLVVDVEIARCISQC